MKQILGILFLGLLLSGNSFAGVEEVIKEIKKNKDIAQGFNEVKEFDTWNEWRVTNKALLKSDKTIREYVVKIVNKSDNHPVRFGNQSLRFEVRAGDGWGWDARNDRERVELLICCVNKKTTWTSWSLYLPNDYEKIFPAKTMLAQFHNDADNPPAFAFDNQSEPNANEGGGYWIGVEEYINKKYLKKKLLDHSEMLGRWNDILVNAKWTHKENGFFKIWINGKLSFHHKGMTQEKGEQIEFHVGIYRSGLSRTSGPDKTQIAYYDEIRHANSCKKLKLNDLGYSCKEIEAQTRIKSIVKSLSGKNSVSLDNIKKALIEKDELSSCILKAGLKEGMPEKKLMKSLRKAKEGKRKHLMKISTFVMNGNCSIN